jgi:hypothetical protein
MSLEALSAHLSELRWLVDELGQELDTLERTSYPRVHCFLMHNLATKIARAAVQVRSSVIEQPPDERTSSDGVHLLEHSA